MTDVHCHLTDDRFSAEDGRLAAVKAHAAGVKMITNGTGISDSKKAVLMSQQNEGVWVCVGVAYEDGYSDLKSTRCDLEQLCENPRVVGIGEAGLDYFPGIPDELMNYQQKLFLMHVELAARFSLPIQIHNRNADWDIMRLLFENGQLLRNKVLLHCYSSSTVFMQQMAEWGCYFSFGGMITYKSNHEIRETLTRVPTERLLLETDSPYLPPEPLRGTRNEPINVKIVAEKVAEIKGVSRDSVEELTDYNASKLFIKIK